MVRSSLRSTHHPELEWFLCCSDSALGLRSSLGAQIAAIERGGGGGGGASADIPMALAGLDLHNRRAWPGARWRRCAEAWEATPAPSRRVLLAHYVLALPTATSGSRQRFPPGVEARLGTLAGVALLAAHDAGDLGALLAACERGDGAKLDRATKRAQTATEAAHGAFVRALRDVDGRRFLAGGDR